MEQTTRKTNKKKLVVALALLALIVVASVITTVVLVLAAQSQTVDSSVNVTYTVEDVAATITGQHKIKGGSYVAMTNSPQEIETNDTTVEPMTPTLTDGESSIRLTSTNDYVIFAYSFKNNTYSEEKTDENGYDYAENEFSVGLTYTDKDVADKNVSISYKVSEEEVTAFDDVDVWSGSDRINDWTETATTTTCTNILYVYVRVEIINTQTSAVFSGDFEFTLTSTGVTEAPVAGE